MVYDHVLHVIVFVHIQLLYIYIDFHTPPIQIRNCKCATRNEKKKNNIKLCALNFHYALKPQKKKNFFFYIFPSFNIFPSFHIQQPPKPAPLQVQMKRKKKTETSHIAIDHSAIQLVLIQCCTVDISSFKYKKKKQNYIHN